MKYIWWMWLSRKYIFGVFYISAFFPFVGLTMLIIQLHVHNNDALTIYMCVIIFIDQRLATQQKNKILHLFKENSIIQGLLSWTKLIYEINGFFHFTWGANIWSFYWFCLCFYCCEIFVSLLYCFDSPPFNIIYLLFILLIFIFF